MWSVYSKCSFCYFHILLCIGLVWLLGGGSLSLVYDFHPWFYLVVGNYSTFFLLHALAAFLLLIWSCLQVKLISHCHCVLCLMLHPMLIHSLGVVLLSLLHLPLCMLALWCTGVWSIRLSLICFVFVWPTSCNIGSVLVMFLGSSLLWHCCPMLFWCQVLSGLRLRIQWGSLEFHCNHAVNTCRHRQTLLVQCLFDASCLFCLWQELIP